MVEKWMLNLQEKIPRPESTNTNARNSNGAKQTHGQKKDELESPRTGHLRTIVTQRILILLSASAKQTLLPNYLPTLSRGNSSPRFVKAFSRLSSRHGSVATKQSSNNLVGEAG